MVTVSMSSMAGGLRAEGTGGGGGAKAAADRRDLYLSSTSCRGERNTVCVFSKTGLKHRKVISGYRNNEPQAPACPLCGFVCPLCDHLLSAAA